MKLRSATSADVAALAAIHAQCFADEVWDEAAIGGLLATPGCFALVDEDLSGFILVRVAAEECELLTLAVAPATRRRGLGGALVSTSCDHAAKLGAAAMFLEVNSRNIPAIALYKRLGFIQVGLRQAYYATLHGMREDALVLRVDIPLLRVGNSLQLG
jgi:ribosomal-protein-alanine N-acetyltransferase